MPRIFDANMDHIFTYLQGDVQSCEEDFWTSDEEVENGKRNMMVLSCHYM